MKEISIKNKVKLARVEKDLTQQELADLVGVTRQTIISIEKGRFVPSTLLALKLATFFKKPVEDIFFLLDNNKND